MPTPQASVDARPAGALRGCGVGLRPQHYSRILADRPEMDWFEAISENYMDTEGRPLAVLERVRERYPVALHGVSLSAGSTDPLSELYLERLARLVRRIEPAVVSDHLCWTGVDGHNLHDLLPLPFTEEAVSFTAGRVARVQERLRRRLLLENVSAYVTYRDSTMPEWEFLTAVARRSGCGILLDLNNVYVNAVNHGFDPLEYLRGVPTELVGQFHLGGHSDRGAYLFDTHGAAVVEKVWELYARALERFGAVPTLIEWDENIPSFERLSGEAAKARSIQSQICGGFRRDSDGADPAQPCGPFLQEAPGLRAVQIALKDRILLRREGRSLDGTLSPQGGEPGGERMAVYAGAYLARMVEALGEVFEAVLRFAGREAFVDLCEGYVEAYPSGEYNLSDVGFAFSRHAAKTAYAAKLPFIEDLAALEWAVSRAFHAPSGRPMDPAVFAGWDEERWMGARFTLQPGCAVVLSSWPIVDLWNARRLPEGQIDLELEGRPQAAFVYRSGLDVRVRAVSAAEASFLNRLLCGGTLGSIVEALDGTAEPLIQDGFASLIRDGLLQNACSESSVPDEGN